MNIKSYKTTTLHGNPAQIANSKKHQHHSQELAHLERRQQQIMFEGTECMLPVKVKSVPKGTLDDKAQYVPGLCGVHCYIRIWNLDTNRNKIRTTSNILRKATKRVLSANTSYEERFWFCGPYCCLFEWKNISCSSSYIWMKKSLFHLDFEDESGISTWQVEKRKFPIKRSKWRKTYNKLLRRTKSLHNFVLRAHKGSSPTEDSLTKTSLNFFMKYHSLEYKWTCRILCRYGHCNIVNKLLTT